MNITFPEKINSIPQLDIFFDSVVHEILDQTVFIQAEFHGCKTYQNPEKQSVTVYVPLVLFSDDGSFDKANSTFIECMRAKLIEVCNHLIGSYIIHLPIRDIDVNIQATVKPVCKVEFIVESEEEKMFIPEVKKIIHRQSKKKGETFTVHWTDNTTTTVKLREGETSDEYTAYLYALGKKLFGNKGDGRKFVKEKKKVFEDEVAQRSAEKERQRRQKALEQSLEAEEPLDITGIVYDQMFVAPALVSRAMFRKNKK